MRFVRFSFATLLISLSLISGCSTTFNKGPLFTEASTPEEGKGLVHIFRPSSMPYLRSPKISLNNETLGKLGNKTYYAIQLEPGDYTLDVDWAFDTMIADQQVAFSIAEGEVKFIGVSSTYGFAGGTGGAPSTSSSVAAELDESHAAQYIETCRLIETSNSFSP